MYNTLPLLLIDFNNKSYPYRLINSVTYESEQGFKIRIRKNFGYDGCTIPRIFWTLIGHPGSLEFLRASLLHDYCCKHKDRFTNKQATLVLREELINSYVPVWKANIMALLTFCWQLTQKGWKDSGNN